MNTIIEKYERDIAFDTSNLYNYEWIRERLGFMLVNYEKNEEMLKNMPHIPVFDLAIVVFVDVTDIIGVSSTFKVQNHHLKVWNVEPVQFIKEAMKNMVCKSPARLQPIMEIVDELLDGTSGEDEEVPMYVLTNASRNMGAGCILYPDMLQACAEKVGKEFYLLPSSIHEMILIPCDKVDDPKELICMVRDINHTAVFASDRLSDHIYKYDREKNVLSMLDIENEHTGQGKVIVRSKISLMTQIEEMLSHKRRNIKYGTGEFV